MTNYIIGIDGGIKGYISLINDKEEIIKLCAMPIIKGDRNTYDINGIVNIFNDFLEIIKHDFKPPMENFTISHDDLKKNYIKCILEKAQPRFTDGRKQSFSTGYCYGVMQAILTTLSIPYEIISPKTWQKEILKDTGDDTKQASILYCKRKYPNFSFKSTERCTTENDNMTDSVNIGLYGIRKV
jgi:hypothetical protein